MWDPFDKLDGCYYTTYKAERLGDAMDKYALQFAGLIMPLDSDLTDAERLQVFGGPASHHRADLPPEGIQPIARSRLTRLSVTQTVGA